MTITTPQESPPSGNVRTRTRSEALGAAIRANLPPEALGEARKSIWKQCREGLYPVAAWGGVWMTAYGMHEGGANPWYVPIGAAALGLSGLALKKVRAWLGKALWRTVWYGGALSLAAVWTAAAVKTGAGMDTVMPSLLVGGGALVAAPWWWVNRPQPEPLPKPVLEIEAAPAPAPAPAFEPEPEEHPHQRDWKAMVGAPYSGRGEKEPLAGALLLHPEELYDHEGEPNGWAWEIDGVKKYTYDQMRSALPRIRLTFDRDDVFSLVQLERSRKGRIGAGRLIIMERNPLRREILWTGPSMERDTGRVPMAVYPDGSGWAHYLLYRPGWGTPHDLLAGGTGSGKSTALRVIIGESICAGSALYLFDPHGGGSFTEAKPRVTRTFLDEREIFAGMRGVQAAQKERLKILREVGEQNMGPEFGHPIFHVVVDEAAHEYVLAKKIIADIMTAQVKEGRKLWMKLTVALQDPSMEAFEDNRELRQQLLNGNVLAYRLGDASATRMVNPSGLDIAPHAIPPSFDADGLEGTSGLGYVIGASRREMVSRTVHATQEAFIEHVPYAEQLDDRTREAFERGYARGLAEWDANNGGESDFGEGDGNETGTVVSIDANTSRARDKIIQLLRERGPMKPVEISGTGVCVLSHAYRVRDDLVREEIAYLTDDGRLALKVS